ncbi:MAG: PilZ domain-containing protein [Oscillospiraceae bacterium]|nr:PilZ domain-containing protein [Oscillospiraceae bacterium]
MKLSHLTKGTKLLIFEEIHNRAVSEGHEAVVRYVESERLVVVSCPWLHENYERLYLGSQLNISFEQGYNVHSFIGVAKSKAGSGAQVVLEQLSEVESSERRKFDRDELRVNVTVYGMSSKAATRPDAPPEFTDISYDLSSGGLCIITNNLLGSKYDPFYILEFSLTGKDNFLLPSKLARRSNYPRTKIGKYDYGFQFIYDNLPEEKGRLTAAILNRKIRGQG